MKSLERVLRSDEFASSPNLRKFLSYVVEQTLIGNDADLKAYSIAIDAFGRSEDFDSQIDPVVRVQAGRLRKNLMEYYSGSGATDPIRIEVPRGSYQPTFHRQYNNSSDCDASDIRSLKTPKPNKGNIAATTKYAFATLIAVLLITLFVGIVQYQASNPNTAIPLISVTRGDPTDTISVVIQGGLETQLGIDMEDIQFDREFRQALSRNYLLSVIYTEGRNERNFVDFVIKQSFLGTPDNRIISLELINGRTNRLVWGNTYPRIAIKDLVSQTIQDMYSELFGASVRALEGRNPQRLSAEQLFVLATWVPGPAKSTLQWEKERISLARLAISKDRNFGPAYSVLADKLAYLAAIDGPSNTKEALMEAAESARLAIELDAGDSNTVFNVANYNWHAGNLYDSIRLQERVLELAPSNRLAEFYARFLPYTCLPPPVRVLQEAIAFDASLSAENPARWVTLTSIAWAHMMRGELEQALEAEEKAAQILEIPYTTIRRAAILNLMGNREEAAEVILQQRTNWPNLNPEHFANVTYPRICQDIENPDKRILLDIFKKLAEDMKELI